MDNGATQTVDVGNPTFFPGEPDDGITEDRMDLRYRLPGGVSLGNHRWYIAQYSEGEGMTFKPGARYCGHGRRDEQGV